MPDGGDPIARSIHAKAEGRFDDALAELDRAVADGFDVARAHYQRGLTLVEMGRRDDAIAAYEAAIALRPDYAKALVNLAGQYNEREDVATAARLLDRAAPLVRSDDPIFLINRACTQRHAGDVEAAIRNAKRACELAPDQVETWIELGRCYGTVHRYKDAVTVYRRAVELAPSNLGACHNYAATLDMLGDAKTALPLAMLAHAAQPNNLHYAQTLGCCLLHVDRAADALPLLEQVERDKPDHFESQYNLACGLARTGHAERAVPHVKRAIELVTADKRGHFLAHIPHDDDLASLRELPAFRALLRPD